VPRKLGQHFLIRESTLRRIAEAACPQPEPLVVEIGPGRGALTAHLLQRAASVVAIELDTQLAAGLRSRFTQAPLTVIGADVLQTGLAQWGPAVIAGNLPYYITSPILDRILALGQMCRRAVFLVQKEVAERITASPGSRDYGFLSVKIQLQTRAELLFSVPPGAFRPPPKVDSAVVRLTPHDRPLVGEKLIAFVGRCFRQKRKTLRNNLGRGDFPEAPLRAEQLAPEQFIELYRRLEKLDPDVGL
jgi:16S rRNA (adenine1518-N6/adenine1519-N6)-dimethyltransferase